VARAEDRPRTSKTDTGRVFNKILANVLRGLRPNEDVRQQELALKIMRACPELVASFWLGAGLTMEPRLSSRWLANIALFGSIIALPVPSRSFLLPGNSSQYHLIPPPLATLLENVLPSVGTKVHISKGLQSPSPMVQHACALALSRCLYKLDDVIKCFRAVEMANEETEETGRWTSRRRELELEARRRVPDFQVILAFVQQYQKTADVNHAKVVLLAELGQRLLWLYHALLPALVSENRFDPSKLLQQFAEDAEPTSSSSSDVAIAKTGLHALRRIHALRLLAEADPIALSAKSSPSSRSNMHVLLKQYLSARETAIQSGIMTLIRRQLGESLLFQHDVSEVDTWLSALRQTPSAPSSSAQPESQPRLEGLLDFIDDSVQRCLKTPYRYLDEWDHIVTSSQHDEHGERIMTSPLIMTILEQLRIKVAGSLMSTASVFEVLAFIRQLVFVLCTSHATFAPFQEYTTRLYDFVKQWNLPASPLEAASRREVAVLSASLLLLKDGPKHAEASLDSDVDFA
jgi:nucleolar pre-ribosomal-associated protein 1